ncbi:aquaporin-like protein [Lophiotrema nucula]|uniref:Aquaporin-like protein n=1 Tax=Lophiotrema nucula TaxID=690887 RepID=A0A6A5ZGQ9_9PLEO|nr:aquaporin-like protein [Lophiotrema nucula]
MEKTVDTILPLSSATSTAPLPARDTERPNPTRTEITVFLGEFIGTFMFLFMAFAGTQIAITSATVNPDVAAGLNPAQEVSKLLYISFAFGAALAVNVAIFADVSGAMFNPAITSSLLLLSKISPIRAVHAAIAQILAGMCAAFAISALLPGTLPSATKLDPTMSIARGLFLELFLTAQLVLAILMIPNSLGKPAMVGLALFVAEVCGVYYTGGGLNPARSFGPSVVVGFTNYHWIYWVGPVVGGALGAGVFKMVDAVKPHREIA